MTTAYRFIPWARRGLAAAIGQADTGADLPARPLFEAGLVVSGLGSAGVQLALYGPGDVIGLDPRTIVRTEPRPHATDVEPNYLAAIEFELPELPWVFSPAAPGASDRLRPWLVLVVLDTTGPDATASPKVDKQRPLPFVTLDGAKVAMQLPDLAQSWAWAHGQQTVTEGDPDTLPRALADAPDLAISRLVCPRRLKPMTSYMACLVPAFDVGVQRGLGAIPAANALARPAWVLASLPARFDLPVYYHWEFATGPDGDFESLARKLKPFKAPETMGTAPMYVSDALPGLDATLPANATRVLPMDGALRASEGSPGQMAQVHAVIQQRLRTEVNAPAALASTGSPEATQAIAAPIYGGHHAKRTTVTDDAPLWLQELNLDPRARAAAGLAAEVVRQNQEEFMQACWEQVGDVLRANMLLNLGALATQALDKLYGRIRQLPPAPLLSLVAPSLIRMPWQGLTIAARVERTSLPEALFSAAYRRLSSGRSLAVRTAAATLGTSAQIGLVDRMAPGIVSAEPNSFVPDGIVGSRAFDQIAVPGDLGASVDLSSIGLTVSMNAGQLATLKGSVAATGFGGLALGADVARSGVVGEVQIGGAQALLGQRVAGAVTDATGTFATLETLKGVAAAAPQAAGFVLELHAGAAPGASALDVDPRGAMVVRGARGAPDVQLGQVGDTLRRGGAVAIARALDELPAGMVASRDATARRGVLQFDRDAGGRVAATDVSTDPAGSRRSTPRTPQGATKTFGPLNRDPAAIGRLASAFDKLAQGFRPIRPGEPKTVPFDLAGAAQAAVNRLAPRANVAARLSSMLSVNGAALNAGGIDLAVTGVTPARDRVFCAPQIIEPAYLRLAAFDREAFVPGIGRIPQNGIALLETNPRFIEAYMVGLNHEMGRELLWRRYPTDQRGTVFRYFWEWDDGQPDIGPIHQFAAAKGLGQHTRGNGEGQLVLLVRGDLLRRYPNSIIYGWPAVMGDGKRVLKDPVEDAELAKPVFHGAFAPDVTMVGFSLTRPQAVAGEGYFFVIEQQPTEPRFGFDEAPSGAKAGPVGSWLDARWVDTGTAPGTPLSLAAPPPGVAGRTVAGATYGLNGAHMAAVSLQRPFRVAIHASYLTSV